MRKLAIVAAICTMGLAAEPQAQAKSESQKLKKSISSMIHSTHYRQAIMGYNRTPTRYLYKHRRHLGVLRRDFRWWSFKAQTAWQQFTHPPHKEGWGCIHGYEGSWRDSGDPYWGGLQMDRNFMKSYAPSFLLRRGYANVWSKLEQMWVAERAHRSGRGYWPWPNTARYCGLL